MSATFHCLPCEQNSDLLSGEDPPVVSTFHFFMLSFTLPFPGLLKESFPLPFLFPGFGKLSFPVPFPGPYFAKTFQNSSIFFYRSSKKSVLSYGFFIDHVLRVDRNTYEHNLRGSDFGKLRS